jgi:hypothetical protein
VRRRACGDDADGAQQHKFLVWLSKREMTGKPQPSTRQIAEAMSDGYDPTHAAMERLRKRGFVQRSGRPARWALTAEGKAALL